MVRPVKSTSSTSTTIRPARSTGTSVSLGQHGSKTDVVPVERDVEAPDRELVGPLDLAEDLGHPRRQGHTPGLQADQDDVSQAAVALDDLVRHPGQGALDIG